MIRPMTFPAARSLLERDPFPLLEISLDGAKSPKACCDKAKEPKPRRHEQAGK